MSNTQVFAINRNAAPRVSFEDFLAMSRRLGVTDVELRNDIKGAEISNGASAHSLREAAEAAGVTIRTINALYPFDRCDADLQRHAVELAAYARDCGAQALVMCPLNSRDDPRDESQRYTDLVHALKTLRPILDGHGIRGLIEPLGFEECALRHKSVAVKAIFDAAGERHYRLLHDTFHHALSGEGIFFPELTGLVHISGVESTDLATTQMRDGHRVLVGAGDRLGNVEQLRALRQRGWNGIASYEPFAAEIMDAKDSEARLRSSMDFIRKGLA